MYTQVYVCICIGIYIFKYLLWSLIINLVKLLNLNFIEMYSLYIVMNNIITFIQVDQVITSYTCSFLSLNDFTILCLVFLILYSCHMNICIHFILTYIYIKHTYLYVCTHIKSCICIIYTYMIFLYLQNLQSTNDSGTHFCFLGMVCFV